MPKAKINDITLYYEIHGAGEPLVLISGFGADHVGWTPVLDAFAKHYQVILLNNRGSGQTDAPIGPYSIVQMAKDTAALCDFLSIKQAHFIGNSMGGYIVQQLAHDYPALTKSIVISNSSLYTESVFHYYLAAQLELMKSNAAPETLMRAMCTWIFSYHYLSQPGKYDELIQWGKSNPYPFTIAGYEGQFAALKNFDSREWANRIAAPTLVLASDHDIILCPVLSKKIVSAIKHAEFYCFETCGHIPHIEKPHEYVRVVQNFLEQIIY